MFKLGTIAFGLFMSVANAQSDPLDSSDSTSFDDNSYAD